MYEYVYMYKHTHTYTHRREDMYISGFVDGVLATIVGELAVIFIAAIVEAIRKCKRK